MDFEGFEQVADVLVLLGVEFRDFLALALLSPVEYQVDGQIVERWVHAEVRTCLRISVSSPSETILSLSSNGSASPESRLLIKVIPGISCASTGPRELEAAPIVALVEAISGILREFLDALRSLDFPWPRWVRTGSSIESVMAAGTQAVLCV